MYINFTFSRTFTHVCQNKCIESKNCMISVALKNYIFKVAVNLKEAHDWFKNKFSNLQSELKKSR